MLVAHVMRRWCTDCHCGGHARDVATHPELRDLAVVIYTRSAFLGQQQLGMAVDGHEPVIGGLLVYAGLESDSHTPVHRRSMSAAAL